MEEPDWVRDELVSLRDYAELTRSFRKGTRTPAVVAGTLDEVDQRIRALQMARRRRADFPAARGGTTRAPLYRLGDLLEFSTRNERTVTIGALPGPWVLVRALDRVTASLEEPALVDQPKHYVLGLIGAGIRPQPPQSALDHLHEVDLPPTSRETLDTAVNYALTAGAAALDLVEAVVERHRGSRSGPSTTTAAGLDVLLSALVRPAPGASVFDPAAGEGDALFAAAGLQPNLDLVGRERDKSAWAVASVRAAARHLDVDWGEGPVDSFDHTPDGTPFDAVLLDPPLPSDTAGWIRLVIRHTSPAGRAAVVVTAAELGELWGAMAPEERAAVAAIIITPDRLREDVRKTLAICVLEPGHGGGVRIIDARGMADWAGSRKQLTAAAVSAITAALQATEDDPDVGLRPVDVAVDGVRDALAKDLDTLFPRDEAVTVDAQAALQLAEDLRKLIAKDTLAPIVTEEHRRGLDRLIRAMTSASALTLDSSAGGPTEST